MKALILFDSLHGNTQQVSQLLGSLLTPKYQVRVVSYSEVKLDEIASTNLLIVGSPTHGGRATPALQKFLDSLPSGSLKNIEAAAFDTRFDSTIQKLPLKLLMRLIGYAAPKITSKLKQLGAQIVLPPQGFFVGSTQGPLDSEIRNHLKTWIKPLL